MYTDTIETINVPKTQFLIMKKVFDYQKKQIDMMRIYEVEESINTWNYIKLTVDDFINQI